MPDTLPPLVQLPEQPLSPAFISQLEHSADWASTFGGMDTNIALRKRHNEDLTAHAEATQQERARQQAELLERDKRAQDLYFGSRRLQLQEAEAKARMEHAAELHPLAMELKRREVERDLQAQSLGLLKARISVEDRAREDADSAGFLLQTKDLDPRDDAFHDKLAAAMEQFPHGGNNTFVRDRVEMLRGRRKAIEEIRPLRSAPGSVADEIDVRMQHLERLRNQKDLPADTRKDLDGELKKVRALRDVRDAKKRGGGAPAASAPLADVAAGAQSLSADEGLPADMSNQDRASLQWAQAHPDDPRAVAIMKGHNLQ